MRNKNKSIMKIGILLIGLFLSPLAWSDTSQYLGVWKTIDDDTHQPRSLVELSIKDNKLYGKIVEIFLQPGEDKKALCKKCKGELKDKPILGMQIINGLTFNGKEWSEGEILDPKKGKTYRCKIWLEDGKLKVRGYIAFFFRTQTWLKQEEPAVDSRFAEIKNFHFVNDKLASSGLLPLDSYQKIHNYGFKHVINLIPGDQTKERAKVESLGMSYQQIEVDWSEPTLDDFERFTALMKSYGKDKVYVHCQANFRASTFVFLYRTTQLGIDKKVAQQDLDKIWQPNETWAGYIEKVTFDQVD